VMIFEADVASQCAENTFIWTQPRPTMLSVSIIAIQPTVVGACAVNASMAVHTLCHLCTTCCTFAKVVVKINLACFVAHHVVSVLF